MYSFQSYVIMSVPKVDIRTFTILPSVRLRSETEKEEKKERKNIIYI